MGRFFDVLPSLVGEGGSSPLRILSLLIVLCALIGIYFFRKGPYVAQVLVFTSFLVAGSVYAWTLVGPKPTDPACRATQFSNDEFQNGQEITIGGGPCGGRATLTAVFSGRSQFANPNGQNAILDVVDDQNKNVCHRNKDKSTTFYLKCSTTFFISKNKPKTFTVIYYTENVSDNPLPKLNIHYEFVPDAI